MEIISFRLSDLYLLINELDRQTSGYQIMKIEITFSEREVYDEYGFELKKEYTVLVWMTELPREEPEIEDLKW